MAEGLVKRFGDTTALAGVSFQARAGTVLGLLGPNGAGKTTAVRILATLARPDSGRAVVGGYDVVAQAHQVRQLIALTGQYAAVDEALTGTENLILIGRLLRLSRHAARQRARELLTQFGLSEACDRAARTYSGGMRRRLDLAASLVGRPAILFLDEPTTGLDPRARRDLWDVIGALVADGTTVMLTTQYLDEADRLADDIVVIDQGHLVATGTPTQLKEQVGGQILQVSPVRGDELDAVVRVVTDFTSAAPDVADGVVTAAVADPAIPPMVMDRLAAKGITVAELSLRRPSLDEVFLSLTGHRTSPHAPAAGNRDGLISHGSAA
jgi:oleandomycin transport system ATP-binding protein